MVGIVKTRQIKNKIVPTLAIMLKREPLLNPEITKSILTPHHAPNTTKRKSAVESVCHPPNLKARYPTSAHTNERTPSYFRLVNVVINAA
jgi:hypothetical protein